MAAEADKVEPADSEQDEGEDVYEVERIIDMRVEEGEVLYRVRWKNYCSDDDTWEPEAHLEDCREVLLAFKKSMADAKAKKEAETKKSVKLLPTKSDVFDADSESDSDKDRPTDAPLKKKKKTKIREEEEEPPPKEKKKKKKDKRKEEFRPLPAPETDEEEEERAPTPSSPPKEKKTELKKRVVDSEEDDDEPVPSKKHKKEKGKEGGKHKKEKGEEGKKKKGKKEKKIETSEDEAAAPLEDDLSDGPSESQMDDTTSTDTAAKSAEKSRSDDKSKQKKGKWEVKLQGIKDLIHDKKNRKPDATQKESSLQKLKSLTSKSKEEAAPLSDSSDSSTLHKKAKSKGQESSSAPPKVLSASASSSSSSSSVTATGSTKGKEEEVVAKEEPVLGPKDATGSTNLFEKFLLNCEAKDRAPRRQPVHQPTPEKTTPTTTTTTSKPAKVAGKSEKTSKQSKDSPAQKGEPEKTEKAKQLDVLKPGQSYGFTLDSDEREGEDSAAKQRSGDESRERREKPEDAQRPGWERKTPTDDRRKRKEDSEPRLFMACDDNQDIQDTPEGADKSDKGQATLSLGMDLNLDWMTLDDFQKHLNGEDEILSGPPLSPSELRDAVKSGDYMAVKLALNSKEDYNLDQEDVSGMSLSMLAAAGGQDDILRLLIKKGVRVNGRQKNGTTALMHAAEKNFLTTVAILLEAGSYVNAQTLGGETALMKACKRGNTDVVRLLVENGADCNILSKHKNTAMYFAKLSNNLMVCDLIKDHISMLSSVAEDTIRAYFESRLVLLEPVFPLACHRLCEGPDFSMEFGFKTQPQPEGSGILLFIFHANFLNEITARLCGPCSVHAVVLNDKFQLPIFLDSHFIYSFSPVPGINRLFIRLAEAPTAKVKLLICAYRVQLQ
ncbi:M-phase phosphoprotein 8 isoform X4 [Larimichthys crocea]|uniref:M-phase phosphoprotein 8 isoform X4 n=1 Tax=Larimichthys crocea TaxID=215358 RepID=UPI00054C51DC|nr:M-phase phosphoprotein 8 isoform X4 [Larimichthys crocea]